MFWRMMANPVLRVSWQSNSLGFGTICVCLSNCGNGSWTSFSKSVTPSMPSVCERKREKERYKTAVSVWWKQVKRSNKMFTITHRHSKWNKNKTNWNWISGRRLVFSVHSFLFLFVCILFILSQLSLTHTHIHSNVTYLSRYRKPFLFCIFSFFFTDSPILFVRNCDVCDDCFHHSNTCANEIKRKSTLRTCLAGEIDAIVM